METEQIMETTVGDLIVALSDETTPFSRDQKEASKVVAFTLVHLLYNSGTNSRMWQYWN